MNPSEWLADKLWTEMVRLSEAFEPFKGLAQSFKENQAPWKVGAGARAGQGQHAAATTTRPGASCYSHNHLAMGHHATATTTWPWVTVWPGASCYSHNHQARGTSLARSIMLQP